MFNKHLTYIFGKITEWLGSPISLTIALLFVVIWIVFIPFVEWDLHEQILASVIGIFTFLLVFISHNQQNRDTDAIHIKLDKILSEKDASKFVGLEDKPQDEVKDLKKQVEQESQE